MSISLKNDAGTFSTNLNQSNPTENVNIALPTTSGTMAKVEDKLVLGTAYTFTGTETFKDFTEIPSWAKRITVMLNVVSTNGASPMLVQLGDSSGIEPSGYSSGATRDGASTTSTAGFILLPDTSASVIASGNIIICKHTSTTWTSSGVLGRMDGIVNMSGGSKTLSDTLDRIRITTVNGTDLFDAGSINIMWE